jgi:putative PEP-CTERM system histidine kinase
MLPVTPVLAYGAALVAYSVFSALLALRGARTWLIAYFVAATALTAAWAAAALLSWEHVWPQWPMELFGSLRDGGWFALVLAVLYRAGPNQRVWRGLMIATCGVVSINTLFATTGISAGLLLGVPIGSHATGIAMAVIGLTLVENMMRNLSRDQFWAIRLLGIGLLAVLVYQLIVRIPEFLTNMPQEDLVAAQPLLFLIVLPLFVVTAVRNPVSALRIYSSRKIAFHSTALICAGVLLQGTAAAAYYVRNYGGDNATVLSIIVGFTCIIALAVAITSGSVRSRLKLFINENFFHYKYDYRLEWDKFIRALSAREEGDVSLRVLRTLAELLDSPGGALWVLRDRWKQFMPVAHWSFPIELAPFGPHDACIAAFESEDCIYLEIASHSQNPRANHWYQLFPHGWLAVPLRYRGALIGVALINKPRADRKLDWEDKNLISLVALQLAAYLVQEETTQALADARQLEEFNKRFAFILHDTKNAVSQLSLLVSNVEQYGHDEEFRKDMTTTLRHSVGKLQGLLDRLTGDADVKPIEVAGMETPSGTAVELCELILKFVAQKRRLGLPIIMEDCAAPIFARLGDQNAFLGVLDHVLTNAVEAAGKGSPVSVGISEFEGAIRVAVIDQGPGMTQEFIADQLFRPFRSTKSKGFGIGAYQAKEVMHDLGGGIEIQSIVGKGTTVALSLPPAICEPETARA